MTFARVVSRRRTSRARSAAILLFGVLAFLALSAPSARAESIWVEPAEGVAGTTFTIKGDLIGCYETGPGPLSGSWGLPDTITFYWDPGSLYGDSGKDPNDMSGLQKVGTWSLATAAQGIDIPVTVPANAKPGQHRIVAELDPKCNYKSQDAKGNVVESDERSYTSAVFCVLEQAGGPCVEYGSGSTGDDGGGGGNGVTIVVVGALVVVALGAVVIGIRGLSPALRGRIRLRSLPPSVDHIPEPCRGIGAALHQATANVTTMHEIDGELAAKLAALKRAQQQNIIKAALGGLVNMTVIVATGASEMAAARKAALAARSGISGVVKEHWAPPSGVMPRLRSAMEVAENSLTAARELARDLRGRLSRLNDLTKRAEMISAHPEVVRARQAVTAADDGIRQAEAHVRSLMGPDPASSPRARYERARGLLSGSEEGERLLRKEVQDVQAELSSKQLELRNRLLSGRAADQPLEPWMEAFLETEGRTPGPGVSRGGAYDPAVAAQLRQEIDQLTAAGRELDARVLKRNELIEQVRRDQERALADLKPLEAAERDLALWKTGRAAAAEEASAVESAINAHYEAQKQRWLEELHAAEKRERQLLNEVDDLRAQVQAEARSNAAAFAEHVKDAQTVEDMTGTAESGPPEKAGPGKPGLLRQGATIVKELVLGVDSQSAEEIGDILREGREYMELTEARRRALARTIEAEQKRVGELARALTECESRAKASAAAEAERRAANEAADERWRTSG